ncbi:MAG: HprK-related kinase A [Moraxellaceae bacterium]|nr:HprK-related kinase A [Moraxellaceae bacterium]
MIVADLSPSALRARLAGAGLRFAAGPFAFRVQSPQRDLAEGIGRLYAAHPLRGDDDFIDFHVAILPGRNLRRFVRPQVRFVVDGLEPFKPLPADQAMPMLEWGLNWCIAGYANHLLMLHAAVLGRGDRAVVMPAPAGSGKSTLCAALALSGWDLLSDELALLDPATGLLHGLARPINLKNASISVIRRFAPEVEVCGPYLDTTKGTVALLRPPAGSVAAVARLRRPAWVVFPKYVADAPARLTPMAPAEALLALADNAFNYHIQGQHGFSALCALLDGAPAWRFEYGYLDEAIACFDELAGAVEQAA